MDAMGNRAAAEDSTTLRVWEKIRKEPDWRNRGAGTK
jgi:hypothetical protein